MMLRMSREQLTVFERPLLARFGREVVAALIEDSPQAMVALSDAEITHRLEQAMDQAQKFEIRTARDLRSFIRLCFVVGPQFSAYPPFCDLLASSHNCVAEMFDAALPDDWDRVAILDIVGRYPAVESRSIRSVKNDIPEREPVVCVAPLTEEHAEAVYLHGLHPDVWRLTNAEPVLSLEIVQRQIHDDVLSRTRKRFAAIHVDAGFAGELALDRHSEGAELSYWIRRDLWGRGIATRAIQELLVIVRSQSMQLSVLATTNRHNGPSIRALEKSGFIEEFPTEMGNERYFALRSSKSRVE